MPRSWFATQQAHDVEITSHRRQYDVMCLPGNADVCKYSEQAVQIQIIVLIKEQPGRCLRCFAIPFSSFGYIGKLFHSLGSCSNCLGRTEV